MTARTPMEVVPLRTGVVRGKRAPRGLRRYLPGGWRDDVLPVYCFAVLRPDGVVLVDAGQTVAAARPGHFPAWHPFFRLARFELDARQEAAAILRELGRDPRDVHTVVLTHLHTDHAGGLSSFAGARVLVSRVEWRLARGLRGRLRGYLPQHWPDGVTPVLVDFDGPPVGPFPGSFDVCADGTIVLVPLPGHTRGHCAAIVGSRGQGVLLAGDAAHTAAELRRSRPDVGAWADAAGVPILTAHEEPPPPGRVEE